MVSCVSASVFATQNLIFSDKNRFIMVITEADILFVSRKMTDSCICHSFYLYLAL